MMKLFDRNSALGLIFFVLIYFTMLTGCNTSGTAGTSNADSTAAAQLLLIPIKIQQSGGETKDGIYAFAGGPGWIEGNPGEKLPNSDLVRQIIRNGYDIEIFKGEGSWISQKYYLKYILNNQTNEYSKDLTWALVPKFTTKPSIRWDSEHKLLYIDSEPVQTATSYQIELQSELGTLIQISPETTSPHNYISVPTLGTYNIVFSAIKIENNVPQSKSFYAFPNKTFGDSDFSE
ncbi:MAG: hypothetical protein HQM08_25545 [Candidatus Riflebacteria bacterium]|nr:hypothetical protein [Candidatus Riflebacteria bacterium]